MPRPSVSEERREEILEAFERCVVCKGIANTTLTDVAQEADQARSLVRYFIGNRDAMISCLIERLLARGEAQLDALREQKASITPEDLAELLLDQVFADETTNIVIIELWQMSLRDEALRVRLASIYQRIVDEVAVLVSAKNENNRIDEAFAAVSMALGAAILRQMGLGTYEPSPLLASIVRAMKGS